MTTWTDVIAAYDALLDAEAQMVRHAEEGRTSQAVALLERLPGTERNVWRTWADATPKLNPGLHRMIDNGTLSRLCQNDREYLERHRHTDVQNNRSSETNTGVDQLPLFPERADDGEQDSEGGGIVLRSDWKAVTRSREAWAQWLEIAREENEQAHDMWTTPEACAGCKHLGGPTWCELQDLPATYNPMLTPRTGMIGMACMGAGYTGE